MRVSCSWCHTLNDLPDTALEVSSDLLPNLRPVR